jgi:hypothetical protein
VDVQGGMSVVSKHTTPPHCHWSRIILTMCTDQE